MGKNSAGRKGRVQPSNGEMPLPQTEVVEERNKGKWLSKREHDANTWEIMATATRGQNNCIRAGLIWGRGGESSIRIISQLGESYLHKEGKCLPISPLGRWKIRMLQWTLGQNAMKREAKITQDE